MGVIVDLSFDTLDEMPGKLRTAACVAPVVPLSMSPAMALQLAARLDQGSRLQAECQELRRLSGQVLDAKADWVAAQDAVQVAVGQLVRRIALVGWLAFAAGVAVGVGLHYAGWF
jgi:hypothetical protein